MLLVLLCRGAQPVQLTALRRKPCRPPDIHLLHYAQYFEVAQAGDIRLHPRMAAGVHVV